MGFLMIHSKENDGIVVVGDFNLPGVTWSEDHTTPMSSRGHNFMES